MTGMAIVAYCAAGVVGAIHGPVATDEAARVSTNWRRSAERFVAGHPGFDIGTPFTVPVEDDDARAAMDVARDTCERGGVGRVGPDPR